MKKFIAIIFVFSFIFVSCASNSTESSKYDSLIKQLEYSINKAITTNTIEHFTFDEFKIFVQSRRDGITPIEYEPCVEVFYDSDDVENISAALMKLSSNPSVLKVDTSSWHATIHLVK